MAIASTPAMTQARALADFAERTAFGDLSHSVVETLKMRVLDAFGCALGALDEPVPRMICSFVDDLGGRADCTIIGGGRTAPDRAAFYNGTLIRYLDFNDSFIAPRETCHPSDNLGAILAAAELAHAGGRAFLTAMAISYAVQCGLSEMLPVRERGLDHTVQGTYAAAAAIGKLLHLDVEQVAHALSIAGTTGAALRVTRTGRISHWKGLASPFAGMLAMQAALLAQKGVTGPQEVFEGNKGLFDLLGRRVDLAFDRAALSLVERTGTKRFNAEVHSQTALEAMLELRESQQVDAADVDAICLQTFDVAFRIIGGGEEGDKRIVDTKEAADHSLPYLLAVALLDGAVMPEQYALDRIKRDDVQTLLRKVEVVPNTELSARFPAEMPARLSVRLRNGRTLSVERHTYRGYPGNPATWQQIVEKFERLAARVAEADLRAKLVEAVRNLENVEIADLSELLAKIGHRT